MQELIQLFKNSRYFNHFILLKNLILIYIVCRSNTLLINGLQILWDFKKSNVFIGHPYIITFLRNRQMLKNWFLSLINTPWNSKSILSLVILKMARKERKTQLLVFFYERLLGLPLFDELNSCLSMKDF